MTETEELRRLLDERGADHEDYEGAVVRTTSWTANDGQSVTFMERIDSGKTMFGFDVSAFTPEEAVAATLGQGTCQMEYVERPTKSTLDAMGVYFCSECGSSTYNDCMPRYCIYCGAEVSA